MIYAAFTYFNEAEMLELYIESTKHFVDRYIIVEGDLTFQGDPKTQNFKYPSNINADRIHYEFMALPPAIETWTRQRIQRNRLGQIYAEERALHDKEDWVIISDVDEIPNVESLKELPRPDVSCWSLDMNLFNYCYNVRVSTNWRKAKYVTGTVFATVSSDVIRLTNSPFVIENGGWHFSNIMPPERYILKHRSISDSRANRPDLLKPEIVAEAMRNQTDLFKLGKKHFDPVVVDLSELPRAIQDAPEKYSDFILQNAEQNG